ncbi:hypothetical protein VVD49_13945 [Uliginosibacterium sp. H3]|uniref:DUF2235 domain-containing protein n=1 Tax=Uliginosibacterium silvisoli TaxID=3114758 RepID=A0ABU6K720_9RHOO|nr:hypothetical protein [Uliginosibacterium sp. H3]
MTTFTVYCHGTGFNSVKGREKDELVAWFHDHTAGNCVSFSGSLVKAGSYMINEGPGHGGKGGIALPQQINPMTGNEKTSRTLGQRANPFSSPSFADHARGNTGGKTKFMANMKGNVDGQGWDENVLRTVNIIQDLKFEKGQDIDRVNLVGWSRGAVTCIRIAHLMHEVFGTSIECNIFGVDPVAGKDAGLTMEDTRILQPNVRRYVAVLAMHEMRKTFKPQDWSRMAMDPEVTTAVLLPMPGVHAAQVIAGTPVDAAHITRNLAAGCLRAWGTPLTGTPYNHLSTPQDMCEAYGRLVLSLSEHAKYQTSGLKNRIIGMGLRRRDFAKHSKMDTYTRGGKESYWVNEHHRACFAAAFPGAYQTIFESTGSGEAPLKNVDPVLFRAMANRNGIRASLMAKGLLVDHPVYTVEIGGGRYGHELAAVPWPAFFPLHA